jgi:hypothetical protein
VGFRYSKRVKIAPGLSVRINKKSVSMTVGGKGARYTINSKGRHTASLNIPGTGVSYQETSSFNRRPSQTRRGQTKGTGRPVSQQRFNPPPSWPTPPQGWAPPPGWQPDRSWPAPPPGWQLWVADEPPTPAVTGTGTPPPTGTHGQRPAGRWYFVITLLSFGMLAWVPFVHAAARLRRRALQWYAVIYGAAAVIMWILASVTPTDTGGNAVGVVGHALEAVFGTLAVASMVIACIQLNAIRQEVYGAGPGPIAPSLPGAADPLVAQKLAARARRDEARALAARDPVLARDLGIGRPDLSSQYDDGGLVDLNSAPAQFIVVACAVDASVADRIVQVREELGSFSSLDEVFVYAQIDGAAAAQIRDHSLLMPR